MAIVPIDPVYVKGGKAYPLCIACTTLAKKKYDLYLASWVDGRKVKCRKCKQERAGAWYRLAEKEE